MTYPSEYYWLIPVAFMVLLIPFFIISTLSEYLVLHRYFLQHHEESIIKTVTQRSNALCYVFIYIMAFSWLTFNLMQR